jgi:hypothetical protein
LPRQLSGVHFALMAVFLQKRRMTLYEKPGVGQMRAVASTRASIAPER